MKKTTFSLLNGQKSILLSLLMILLSSSVYTQTTYYVKENGSGNGTSWTDASGDIQLLINNASSGDQIWVAAGTYKPNRKPNALSTITPNDRQNSFVLKAGVEIYGGFNGTETSIDQRDWFANETILSGDYNDNDLVTGSGSTLSITNNGENALHVVVSFGDAEDGNAILDGFTITGGNANDQSLGMIVDGHLLNSRCGGGIYSTVSSPILKNLNITGNVATYLAAGVYVFTGISSPPVAISNSFIDKNENPGTGFVYGGGIFADVNTKLDLINVTLTGNKGFRGGGIGIGGATSVINLTNVTIAGNYAGQTGGGISFGGVNSTFNVQNSIVYGNTSAGVDNVYISSGSAGFANSLIQGSGGSANWNPALEGIHPDGTAIDLGNNIDVDPVFLNPENGDFRLAENSEAVNTGSNSLYADAGGNLETDKDVAGNDRLIDDIIDMGAHEFKEGTVNIEDHLNSGFVIYPNPVADVLNITGLVEITSVSVYDISGKELIRQNANNQNVTLDVSSLSAGIYLVNIISGNKVQTVKLVKR